MNDYLCPSGGASECPLLVSDTRFPPITVCIDAVSMPFDEPEEHHPIYPPMPDQAPIDPYPDVQHSSPPPEPPTEDHDPTTSAPPIDSQPEVEHSPPTYPDEYEQPHSSPSTYSEEVDVVDSSTVTQRVPDEMTYERSDRALGVCIVNESIVGHTGNALDMFWQQRVIRNARGDDGRYDGEWNEK